jgi:hypothetical protein
MGPAPAGDVSLTLTSVPQFAQGDGHFELWISFATPRTGLRHSSNASAGKFKVREGGQIVGLDYQPVTFQVNRSDSDVPRNSDGEPLWDLAVDALVTIEPAEDPNPDSPGPAWLGGSFLNGTATLSSAHGDALGTSLTGASGSFVLATPTTSATTDEREGIWFVAPGGASGALTLPTLPATWTYEAWVSNNSAAVASLGKFVTAGGADSDGGGPLTGGPPTDAPGYAFPGSDFPYASPGVDLSATSVFITIEPVGSPDGAGPFFLELMGAPVPGGTSPGTTVAMSPAGGLPGGSVRLLATN